MKKNRRLGETLPNTSILKAEVVWSVQHEMARTVEDFLGRRRRTLFLNARVALEAAPEVAKIMARELGKEIFWKKQQIKAFQKTVEAFSILDICPDLSQ